MAGPLRRRNALLAFARAFKPGTPGVGRRFAALPRLIKASFGGRYDGKARVFLMLLAAAYIISPFDFIPDFLLPFGIIDDAFVLTWLTGTLFSETERFLEWEQTAGNRPPKVVQVVRRSKAVRVKR